MMFIETTNAYFLIRSFGLDRPVFILLHSIIVIILEA